MTGFAVAAAAVCLTVLAEILIPGQAVYHTGWFNTLMLAVVVGLGLSVEKLAASVPAKVLSLTLCVAGVAVTAAAGIAYGLLAPDDAIAIAAPDANVRVDDLGGTLHFEPDGRVTFARGWSQTVVPRSASRLAGDFVLRSIPRDDVAIDAFDARGGHLTITQPNGTLFLSPVLTMQLRQTIAGVALPFDTFAVPALHRIVHVVLFDPHQAVALLPSFDPRGGPAILFAVDDDTDRPIPAGIAVARSGATISVAGLRLRAIVTSYPAIQYLAVPMPSIVALGLLIVLLGVAWPAIAVRLDARRSNR